MSLDRMVSRAIRAAVALTAAWAAAAVPLGAAAATAPVTIADGCGGSGFCFTPSTVGVHAGDTVSWTSHSGAAHTVTRCTVAACGVSGGTGSQAGPASGLLSSGQTYAITLTAAGTYVYYCSIHGYAVMHGTVTVAALPTPEPSSSATPAGRPAATPAPAVSGGARGVSTPDTGALGLGAPLAVPALLLLGVGAILVATGRRRP